MGKRPRETLVSTACAWCGGLIRVSTSPWTGDKTLTTHGLCPDCLRRFSPRGSPRQPAASVQEPPREER